MVLLIEILHKDDDIIVCVKPAGLISEAGKGSLPEALKAQTELDVYAVHRLDATTRGLMVYALNKAAAAKLSAQMQSGSFCKCYLAVVRGIPDTESGTYADLLFHDRRRNKSFVVDKARAGVKRAVLDYHLIENVNMGDTALSLLKIHLHTGRTHQIRVQFSSRGTPLYGDGKYGGRTEKEGIALLSYNIGFTHPASGKRTEFTADIPQELPWKLFDTENPKFSKK